MIESDVPVSRSSDGNISCDGYSYGYGYRKSDPFCLQRRGMRSGAMPTPLSTRVCSSYICYVVALTACASSTFGNRSVCHDQCGGILSSFFSFILTSNAQSAIHSLPGTVWISTIYTHIHTYIHNSGKRPQQLGNMRDSTHAYIYTYMHTRCVCMCVCV
jgi:hypothetical protein